MAGVLEVLFDGGAPLETVGTAGVTISGAAAAEGPTGAVFGFPTIKSAVDLAGAGVVTIPVVDGLNDGGGFGVEVVLRVDGAPSGRLFSGTAFPLVLDLTKAGTGIALTVGVRLTDGWANVELEKGLLKPGVWQTIAAAFDGDDLLVAIDGQIVARRCLYDAEIDPSGSAAFEVGSTTKGIDAALAAIRLSSGVPASLAAARVAAEAAGLGEIDSLAVQLGTWIGSPKGPEKRVGSGIVRRYQHALLAWSPNTGAHEVHGAILAKYEKLGGAGGFLGLPTTDEVECPGRSKARQSSFQFGIISWSKTSGAHEMHGDIVVHWVALGGAAGRLGLPTSDEGDAPNGGRMSTFEHATVYWTGGTGAREVHGAILEKYAKVGGPGGVLGYPLTDERDILDGAGKATGGKVSRFEYGAIYWSSKTGAHEVHGAIRELYEGSLSSALGLPTSDEVRFPKKVCMSEFERGVIAYTPAMGAFGLTELTVSLGDASAPSIDDGYEGFPPSADRTAEMYVRSRITINGETKADRRSPNSGHGGKVVGLPHKEVSAGVPRLDTRIDLSFRAWDYDELSGDDALGATSATFTAETIWGLADNTNGTHSKVGKGGHGKVTYTWTIAAPSKVDPGLPFRQQFWWGVQNFETPKLTWEQYATTFSDVEMNEDWWDAVTNPIDALYYELAYDGVAASGNCYGMCTEAVHARHGRSPFRQPVSQVTSVHGLAKQRFNLGHGAQLGAAAVLHTLGAIANTSAFRPNDIWDRVRRTVRAGRTPIVSMFNFAEGSGHSVLAYDVKAGSGGSPNIIFVADPNVPFSEDNDPMSSRIEIKSNTFTFFANGAASSKYVTQTTLNGAIPLTMLVDLPESVVAAPVRTPFADLACGLETVLGGLILVGGGAETTQVTANGTDLYGASIELPPSLNEDAIKAVFGRAARIVDDRLVLTRRAARLALRRITEAGAGGPTGSRVRSEARSAVRKGLRASGVLLGGASSGRRGGRGLVEPEIKVADAIADAIEKASRNAVPSKRAIERTGLVPIPLHESADDIELFAARGHLPDQLAVDFRGDGSDIVSVVIRGRRSAVSTRGEMTRGEKGQIALTRGASSAPGVSLSSSREGATRKLDYVVHHDERGRPARRLQATLRVGPAAPTTFCADVAGTGATIEFGVPSPRTSLSVEMPGKRGVRKSTITIPAAEAGEAVSVRPRDLASPLGQAVVERIRLGSGELLERIVLDPD